MTNVPLMLLYLLPSKHSHHIHHLLLPLTLFSSHICTGDEKELRLLRFIENKCGGKPLAGANMVILMFDLLEYDEFVYHICLKRVNIAQ